MAARLVVLLLMVVAVPMRSAADVAGTGTFDIFATANGSFDFDGAIAFDGGVRTVLGRQVNLARFVGTMTYDGEVLGEPSARTAIFTLEADADETDVSLVAGGSVSCTTAACIGGSLTFAGRLEVTFDEEDALPDDGAFTFDGTVELDEEGEGFGTFAINAFPVLSTPVGAGVEVDGGQRLFVDSVTGTTRSFAARATFDEVAIEGTTSFVGLSTGSGTLPLGVVLDPAVSVFVDVHTTALGDGLEICLAFADETGDGIVDGTDIPATELRLLRASFVGSAFEDVPATPGAGEVCASVADLRGLYVLGVADATGATTTTIVTGETTTTSTIGSSTTLQLPGETTTTTVVGEPGTTTSSTVSGESTTTTSTMEGETSTTTSSTVSTESTTTTISGPESTSTTCSSTTTSSTVATTLPSPGPTTSTSTTISRASTTSSTLPVCATALECLELTIAGPLCPGETLNPKLATLALRKMTKAQAVLARARTAASAQKAGRLVAKAQKQLDRIGKKADAFVSRRRQPISLECRDRIRAALHRVAQQIDANRI